MYTIWRRKNFIEYTQTDYYIYVLTHTENIQHMQKIEHEEMGGEGLEVWGVEVLGGKYICNVTSFSSVWWVATAAERAGDRIAQKQS